MNKTPKIIRTRNITGIIDAGWMTPQLQIQITPLHWGLSFVFAYTDKIPTKVGFKVGPVAAAIYVGKGRFESHCDFNNTPSVTFKDGR